MQQRQIFYIQDINDLSQKNYLYIYACLEVFRDFDVDENDLIKTLKNLLDYEGFNNEMYCILTGREIASEYIDPNTLEGAQYIKNFEKMGTKEVIIFVYNPFDPYDPYEVIMPEKLGIKIITDWCAENATNPKIPALCEQLKEKYGVTE